MFKERVWYLGLGTEGGAHPSSPHCAIQTTNLSARTQQSGSEQSPQLLGACIWGDRVFDEQSFAIYDARGHPRATHRLQ